MLLDVFKKPVYISVPKAAEFLDTSDQNVYDQIKKKHIYAEIIPFGDENRYRIPADRFKEFMRQRIRDHEEIAAHLRESSKKLEEIIRNA